MENYLTVADICESLQVCRQTVAKYIAAGKIKAVKVGRLKRVAESEIARFLATKTAVARSHSAPKYEIQKSNLDFLKEEYPDLF